MGGVENKGGTPFADDGPRYPHAVGYRNTDTSKAAAESVKDAAPCQRRSIIECLRDGAELTGDEIAALLRWERWSVRPRLAELRKLGTVEDTGARRTNAASGRRAIVWRLIEADGRADEPRSTESQAA